MSQWEWTAHQRSAKATFWLQSGNLLTTAEIARLTGMSWHGAEYMMNMISRVLPILQNDAGQWYWLKPPPE